jgi:spermidine synthase
MTTLYDAAGQQCWITVTEEFSTRSLLLDGCEEGAMQLDSEEPVFAYLWFHKCSHLARSSVRRALVLGAGAFTAAKCLALDHSEADINAVDLEPDLGSIGRKFFRLDQPEFSRIHFHGIPAEEFLKTSSHSPLGGEGRVRGPGCYDFIFDDLFDGFQHVPESARSADHLRSLRAALSPGGICVKNMIWDPLSANARTACAELREAWTQTWPNRLTLAMGNPIRGHNVLLLGTTAEDAFDWPLVKERLASAELPAAIMNGIRAD